MSGFIYKVSELDLRAVLVRDSALQDLFAGGAQVSRMRIPLHAGELDIVSAMR